MKKIFAIIALIAAMLVNPMTLNAYASSDNGFTDVDSALPAIPVN